ncbi:hypothetical protein R1sor_026121 [Riccia sorocarpa]|uniref:DUF4283 domain-containing protein n=1 Tax=Riccia sorocarpa TaxID=122646 RepID=A0ABD3GAI7_9MARC
MEGKGGSDGGEGETEGDIDKSRRSQDSHGGQGSNLHGAQEEGAQKVQNAGSSFLVGPDQAANPLGYHMWKGFQVNGSGRGAIGREERSMGSSSDGRRQAVVFDWSAGITADMIAAELEDLRTVADLGDEEDDVERVLVWVRETLVNRKGARVSLIRAMSRKEFLIVFESREDRETALDKPPCFLDGKLVRLIAWSERHKDKILPHLKAVWVELREMPPFLEEQSMEMLAAIGPMIYQATDKQELVKFANVRGCVMVDMGLDLPKFVGIKTPWEKVYLQSITLPSFRTIVILASRRGTWRENARKDNIVVMFLHDL